MAKSIRVSDGIYELAASAGAVVNRSLAEQIEYWARLGAALDASGLSMDDALKILRGDLDLKMRVLDHVASAAGRTHQRRSFSGHAGIEERKQRIERQVQSGERSARSLILVDSASAQSATLTPRSRAKAGSGW